MSYPFEKLVGRRVLLNKPERPKSVIELTPETAAKLDEEFAKKWNKLEIYAVGEDVESWKAGDFVFVPGFALQQAEAIDLDGSVKIMIGEHDIAFKWKEGPVKESSLLL
jgi:hypothetical protein